MYFSPLKISVGSFSTTLASLHTKEGWSSEEDWSNGSEEGNEKDIEEKGRQWGEEWVYASSWCRCFLYKVDIELWLKGFLTKNFPTPTEGCNFDIFSILVSCCAWSVGGIWIKMKTLHLKSDYKHIKYAMQEGCKYI